MNTARIISRYLRPDGSLEISAAQLTHELIDAHHGGRIAGINGLEKRLSNKHPKNRRGGKLGIHTVGANA
jgi:hypothetical protein